MSLQVWMPLNGDTNNQGICDTVKISSGTPQYTVGKIGQGISLNQTISFTGLPKLNKFSIFFWAKVDSCTVNWSDLIGFTSKQADDSSAAEFRFEATIDTRACSWHNNSPYAISTSSRILIQNYSEWHHVGVVYDGQKIYSYIDGELTYTDTGLGGYLTTNFHIGQTGYLVGAMNDLRVYDDVLSKLEAKKLSQTCILHYNFEDVVVPYPNDKYNYENIKKYANQIQGVAPEGTLTKTDETFEGSPVWRLSMTPTTEAQLTDFHNTLANHGIYVSSFNLDVGKVKTFAILYRNITHKDTIVGGCASNKFTPTNLGSSFYKDGWYRTAQTRTNNTTSSGTDSWFVSIKNSSIKLNEEIVVDFCCPEEYSDIDFLPERIQYEQYSDRTIYDSSGYGHNGILSGGQYNAIFRPSDIEGNHCLEFIGDPACYIDSGQIFYDDINQCHTVCAWVKKKNSSIANQQLINFNMGYKIQHSASSTNGLMYINNSTNDCYSYHKALTLDTWEFLCYVMDRNKGIKNIYINGELANINNVGDLKNITPYGISKNAYFGVNFKGYLDDIRIYATALSQEDIQNLYRAKAQIDNKNNLLVQNVNEPSNIVAVEVENALMQGKTNRRLRLYSGNSQYRKVELIDGKVHIWRSPNNTNTGNSSGNYTGFAVGDLKDILEKDHIYLFSFDIEGVNDSPDNANASLVYTIGWGGCGGLDYYSVPSYLAHFNGKEKIYFLYDLRGKELWQAATKTEGSVVAGTYYPIYNNFFFRFNYSTTGEKGTDVYISNISMQDITNNTTVNINKKYIINGCNFEEKDSLEKINIDKNNQVLINQIIEI